MQASTLTISTCPTLVFTDTGRSDDINFEACNQIGGDISIFYFSAKHTALS